VPNGRIILAEDSRMMAELTADQLRQRPEFPASVVCDDGFRALSVFTKLQRSGQPPSLVILDMHMPRIGGATTALAMRAVERGLRAPTAPILFYTVDVADEQLKGLLGRVGRAVHLQKAGDARVEEQARRLVVAVERLLAQLRGGS